MCETQGTLRSNVLHYVPVVVIVTMPKVGDGGVGGIRDACGLAYLLKELAKTAIRAPRKAGAAH